MYILHYSVTMVNGSVSDGASGARAPLDFQRFPKGTTQFVKNVEILCFSMDFCGFGQHSTKIATGATVMYLCRTFSNNKPNRGTLR